MVFWGFSNSTGESILNSLETVYLGDVYVEEERIAVATLTVLFPLLRVAEPAWLHIWNRLCIDRPTETLNIRVRYQWESIDWFHACAWAHRWSLGFFA